MKNHQLDINEKDLEIFPLERSETIPSHWYYEHEIFQFEKRNLFTSAWQFAGHLNQINNDGDFILAKVGDNPIIVVRENQEKVHAFFNVCRHRGGPIAFESGNCKLFHCKYHGWTYKLDGSLRGVPRFDRVELFDKSDFGLVPAAVNFWEGLIFINLSSPTLALNEQLEEISKRISPINLSTKKHFKRVTYNANCNWKVYIDNYLEGYHLPYVHPELCNLLDLKEYKTEIYDLYSLQISSLKSEDSFYGDGEGEAFYYFIFPNIMLNILPGRLQTNFVIPISENKCEIIFDYYYDEISSEKSNEFIQKDIIYSDKIQMEDIEICEHVQIGLESNAYHKGRFSVECELGVYHFQNLLKNSYKKYLS